jgi:hypothetical protein
MYHGFGKKYTGGGIVVNYLRTLVAATARQAVVATECFFTTSIIYDTQHNYTKDNNTQHNDTQHYETQH